MFQKILFPTDNSKHSQAAAAQVGEIAAKFQAEVVLLYVYDTPVDLAETWGEETSYYVEKLKAKAVEHGNKILEETQNLVGNGVTCKKITQDGDPGMTILKVADEEGCDLVVMGRRGLGVFKEFLLGSVSNYVAHNAKCPVLLAH